MIEGRVSSLNGHSFGPYHYAGMGNTERECLTCHFRQDEQLEDERVPPCTSGRVQACQYCGEEIARDEHGIWHHVSDDAIVCAIGLDTDQPGSIAIQHASPPGTPPLRNRR